MAKITALYTNELIKISKKTSVYVLLIIMVIAMIATGGLLKYAQTERQNRMSSINSTQLMKSDMQSRLSNLQTQQTQTNSQLASANPAQKLQLQADAASIGYQIDSLNTAINMNVYLYTNYYVAQAIQDVATYKTEAYKLQAVPDASLTQAQKDEKTLLASLIPRMENVIKNKDFKDYTAIINEKLNADTDVTQTDKDIQLEQNNLRLKYNVTNEDQNNKIRRMRDVVTADDVINNIDAARRSLAYNLDFSANQDAPVPLTSERRAQITDNVTVYLKQLDTGATATNNFSNMSGIMSVGIIVFELLLLILAGGAISQEISTGSIKSLIISPTKRWKIYFAKLLSLITVGLIAAIICYFIGLISYGAFFGFSTITPYVYASSGKAFLMSFYSFTFKKLFIGLIPVAFYMIFALMMSTVTRNTAASVGISIGVLFAGTVGYPALSDILTGEWMKFLPFANFDFASKIYTFDPSVTAATGVTTSIAFSTIYIIITIGLMFYIGLDSFNRRDIK